MTAPLSVTARGIVTALRTVTVHTPACISEGPIPFHPLTRIEKLEDGSFRVTVRAGADGAERTIDVGLVMMATGRKPRIQGLGLEVGGLVFCGLGIVGMPSAQSARLVALP